MALCSHPHQIRPLASYGEQHKRASPCSAGAPTSSPTIFLSRIAPALVSSHQPDNSVFSAYWTSAQHSTAQNPKQASSFLLDADQPPAPSSPPKLAAAAAWMLTPRGWPESVPHLDIAGSPAGPAAAAPGAALCLGSSTVRSSLVADASLHHGRGRDHRRVSSSCRAWPQSHQTTPSAAAKLKLEEARNSTLKKLERSHVLQIFKKHCVL